MTQNKTTSELISEYQEAAAGTGTLNSKTNNESADKVHICYKHLRASAEGRAGIICLLSHDNPHVRLWAAGHSLQWVPEIARPVLETLRDNNGPGAIAAEWTLKEYDEGSLSFDY